MTWIGLKSKITSRCVITDGMTFRVETLRGVLLIPTDIGVPHQSVQGDGGIQDI